MDVMKEIVSCATSSKHCTWTFTPTFDPESAERTFREFTVACWTELIEEAVGITGSFVCPFILGSDSKSTLSCHFALHPPRACQPPCAQLLIAHVVESPWPHRWRPASECSLSDLDPDACLRRLHRPRLDQEEWKTSLSTAPFKRYYRMNRTTFTTFRAHFAAQLAAQVHFRHIHTHPHTHIHTHTHTHKRTHTHALTQTHTRIHTHSHSHTHTRTQTPTHVCTHTIIHTRTHTHTHTHTHTRTYMHTHKNKQTHTITDDRTHTRTHAHALSHMYTHAIHARTHSLSLPLSVRFSLSLSHTLSFCRSLALTHTLSLCLTQTHTHTYAYTISLSFSLCL